MPRSRILSLAHYWLISLLLGVVAIGCGKPLSPKHQTQAWVNSWADLGMYLPEKKQVAFIQANLTEVTPELVAAFSHPNANIRQRAAFVVSKIGPVAASLGPSIFLRLKKEPERIVRIYMVNALASIQFCDEKTSALLREQYQSLSSENVPPQILGGYSEVDEKVNLAAALYVLSKKETRDLYLDFVIQWLQPLSKEMTPVENSGYWERRWMAVISLEAMPDATEAIPLLESMAKEMEAPGWVSIHVPRVLGVLRAAAK